MDTNIELNGLEYELQVGPKIRREKKGRKKWKIK